MNDNPRPGDRVGTRTVVHVSGDQIVFGERIGKVENCGAWLTNVEEWSRYADMAVAHE